MTSLQSCGSALLEHQGWAGRPAGLCWGSLQYRRCSGVIVPLLMCYLLFMVKHSPACEPPGATGPSMPAQCSSRSCLLQSGWLEVSTALVAHRLAGSDGSATIIIIVRSKAQWRNGFEGSHLHAHTLPAVSAVSAWPQCKPDMRGRSVQAVSRRVAIGQPACFDQGRLRTPAMPSQHWS